MKKVLIIYIIIIFCTSCNQRYGKNFQNSHFLESTEKMIVEKEETSMFSTSMLDGSSWLSDNRDYYDRYEVFTEKDYMCVYIINDTSNLPKEKDGTRRKISPVSTSKYQYYLSAYRPVKFDSTKVGKNTRGNFLVSRSGIGKMFIEELICVSPTKLILVQDYQDTISFTRKDWIEK